jgi:hypothetical protein
VVLPPRPRGDDARGSISTSVVVFAWTLRLPDSDRTGPATQVMCDIALHNTSHTDSDKETQMFGTHRYSRFPLAATLAVALVGCVEAPPEDTAEPTSGEIASSLSSTAPVTNVVINFHTGNDDKRSDSRVWARIGFKTGHTWSLEIAPGVTWPSWTSLGNQWILLPAGTRNGDIQDISIEWRQGGSGIGGDEWSLQGLTVNAWDPSYGYAFKGAPSGNPLQRFTGQVWQYVMPWTP